MNPNGRPTEELKDYTVKFRLSGDMYKLLVNRADREKVSVSELLREILRKTLD